MTTTIPIQRPTPAQGAALVAAMKAWRDRVTAAGLVDAAGRRYTPRRRTAPPLKYVENLDGTGVDDPALLYAEMRSIIDLPDFGIPSTGWLFLIHGGRPDLVWEYVILDKAAPYAPLWTDDQRARVARAIADTYG